MKRAKITTWTIAGSLALACGLGLSVSRPANAKPRAPIGIWKASKQIVRGKPVRKKHEVTWEFKKGGDFVSTTIIPKRYPFKRQGKWKIDSQGKLVVTLGGRDRSFIHRIKGKTLKLVEKIGQNKLPRVYRLTRVRARSK